MKLVWAECAEAKEPLAEFAARVPPSSWMYANWPLLTRDFQGIHRGNTHSGAPPLSIVPWKFEKTRHYSPAPLDAHSIYIGDAVDAHVVPNKMTTLADRQAISTTILFGIIVGISLALIVATLLLNSIRRDPWDARLFLSLAASILLLGGFSGYYAITRGWIGAHAVATRPTNTSNTRDSFQIDTTRTNSVPRLLLPKTGSRSAIPRTIHQIWVGPKPMSESTQALTDTLRAANPTFTWRLWGNDDLTSAHFSLLPLIAKAKSYAQVADLMRYEILHRYGGVYFDTDFEGFSTIEPILQMADLCERDLVVCHETSDSRAMSNSWIAATPGATALAQAVESLKENGFDATLAENFSTGPFFWVKWYKSSPYLKLHSKTFYPY